MSVLCAVLGRAAIGPPWEAWTNGALISQFADRLCACWRWFLMARTVRTFPLKDVSRLG